MVFERIYFYRFYIHNNIIPKESFHLDDIRSNTLMPSNQNHLCRIINQATSQHHVAPTELLAHKRVVAKQTTFAISLSSSQMGDDKIPKEQIHQGDIKSNTLMLLEHHCLHLFTNLDSINNLVQLHRDDIKPKTSMVFDQSRLYRFYIPCKTIPREQIHEGVIQ